VQPFDQSFVFNYHLAELAGREENGLPARKVNTNYMDGLLVTRWMILDFKVDKLPNLIVDRQLDYKVDEPFCHKVDGIPDTKQGNYLMTNWKD
jgi:hypothetical protein